MSEQALQEIGRIIKLFLNGQLDPLTSKWSDAIAFSYHSDLIGDMIHFRYFPNDKLMGGDVNGGGHFNAIVPDMYISLLCQHSSTSATVFL